MRTTIAILLVSACVSYGVDGDNLTHWNADRVRQNVTEAKLELESRGDRGDGWKAMSMMLLILEDWDRLHGRETMWKEKEAKLKEELAASEAEVARLKGVVDRPMPRQVYPVSAYSREDGEEREEKQPIGPLRKGIGNTWLTQEGDIYQERGGTLYPMNN